MGGKRITYIEEARARLGKPAAQIPKSGIAKGRGFEKKVNRMFDLMKKFAAGKTKEREELAEIEKRIHHSYSAYSPEERVFFFARLYDEFAEGYDQHMGTETNHYKAIRRVMGYAAPYIVPPLLDITAGTGEPLKYAMEIADRPGHYSANEISTKMLSIARRKFSSWVLMSNQSAYDLPPTLSTPFNTVICSQTFHLISDEDKPRMVRAIRESLAAEGVAIVIEEEPFRITPTEYLEAAGLFLRAVVRPIESTVLAGHFQAQGFINLNESATCPIDSEHSMRLHLFRKI